MVVFGFVFLGFFYLFIGCAFFVCFVAYFVVSFGLGFCVVSFSVSSANK